MKTAKEWYDECQLQHIDWYKPQALAFIQEVQEDAAWDMRDRAESACHDADSCRVACCNGCEGRIHDLPLLPGGET